VLSPLLFNVYIDRVTKETQNYIKNPLEIEQENYEQLNNPTNEFLLRMEDKKLPVIAYNQRRSGYKVKGRPKSEMDR
jgi:hypothetical protein